MAQRPTVRPLRLDEGQLPRIDGALSEPLWQQATLLGELTQVRPVEGAPAAQPTEVRLAYDADFLYIGVTCDEVPGQVRARQRDYDANIQYDDVLELWFDTFGDQTNGYWFQISAGGSRGDALLSDGGQRFNKDWDGIWYGRVNVTRSRWTAELAIPFRTLAFREGNSDWNFNFNRKRVVAGENQRWATPDNAYRFFDLTVGGRLAGLTGARQGLGLDVVPYAKASGRRNDGTGTPTWRGDAGLDLVWRPTPGASLILTVNTDFAETEVDERQINLTRFPLFFPEKRDFFLQDAGIFEFGAPRNRRSLVPFFSRTVGRDADGLAVPIEAGVRYTGRHGPWTVGLLDVQQGAGDVDDGRNLAVARVQYALGAESTAGAIVTSGRSTGDGDAGTVGLDLRLGSSEFFGPGHSGRVWLWGLQTDGAGVERDEAFGLEAQARDNTWDHSLAVERIGAGFDPELGFVRRTGVDNARAQSRYIWRTSESASFIRAYDARIAVDVTEDRVGEEDNWAVPVRPLGLRFSNEARLEYEVHQIHESLDDGFELGDVMVSPGEYDQLRHFLELESSPGNKLLGELGLEYGDFYSGTLRSYEIEPIFVPNGTWTLGGSFTDVEANLVEGRYRTQLYSLRVDYTPHPDLSWKNLVQYDTESKNLGLQSRLRWIIEPGRDLFLVGLFGWNKPATERAFTRTEQDLALKLTYTWRF